MNPQTSQNPTLCIDLKKNRIRIHKLTLHLLGDPDYIQLLVNPATNCIAIQRCRQYDHLSHHVSLQELPDRTCCELYSTELLQTLREINDDWENNCSYRLYGKINRQNGVAWFAMKDIMLIGECL